MPRVFSADELLNDTFDVTTPVFLDTTSWQAFQDWSKQNLIALQHALKSGLRFWIFKSELSYTQPRVYRLYLEDQLREDSEIDDLAEAIEAAETKVETILSFESRLEANLGIKFHEEELPSGNETYRTFLYEVQEIYFHDVSNRERCDRHAEFVFLSRRASRSENKLCIMTAQPAFQRLVNAEIFLLPVNSNNHRHLLPANFDIFTELQIHPRIRQVVELDYRNRDYPKVVFQAVNAFRDFVREIVNSTEDGGTLMNEALNLDYKGNGRDKKVSRVPPLLINSITVDASAEDSLVGEQEGFYRFAQGVFKAIRNPNAHATATDRFIQQRFNDENTAIKVLCFLSMLCERIDNGKRYSP